jgi:hypothetical protein
MARGAICSMRRAEQSRRKRERARGRDEQEGGAPEGPFGLQIIPVWATPNKAPC